MSKMISPKPWRIDHLRSLDMRAQITDKNGNIICSAYYHTRLKHNNAHLIAAAPELLEACEAAYHSDKYSLPTKTRVSLKNAIAAAKGES